MDLDNIAKEISMLDFSEVNVDDTDEAIYNIAMDLYNLDSGKSDKVVEIIMEKYIQNLE